MELPDFKYHPNPMATGSIVPSAEVCPVCGETRGFAYDGIPYGTNELEHICPWYISSGAATVGNWVATPTATEVP
jgi:uncharacterized protein CbrC (UPF0167 family)